MTSVKCDGHVSSNIRKGARPRIGWAEPNSGQKLVGYELAVAMEWEGHISDASGDFCVTGRVEIPCLTEDQELKDTEISIFDDKIEAESMQSPWLLQQASSPRHAGAPLVDKQVAELATHEISRGDVKRGLFVFT